MPTKTGKCKTHAPPRLRGTMTDASRLRNPYARGRRIRSRSSPRPQASIRIVDRTAEGIEPRLLVLGAEPLMILSSKIGKHTILYRCRYGSGREDQELHERDVFAATTAAAVEQLQERLVGFDVEAVEIFAVRPPLTREQVAEIQAMNEELGAEKRTAGIYGEGLQREKAIEAWLGS